MATQYQTALITGASSGLGRGLALWLARRGVKVYAAARRAQQLEELAALSQGSVVPFVLDVAKTSQTLEKLRALDQECGGLDLVIANAGVGEVTNARKLDWDRVQRTIDVNVTGAAATLCAALPAMVERGRGHLVGVSSLAAFRGFPGSAAYCASKAFLQVFLEGLRVDLRGSGLKVTSIHPGYVKSEMTANTKGPMPFLLETEDAVERMGKAIYRGDAEFSFPWQIAGVMKAMRLMPNGIYDLALGAGRKRGARKVPPPQS
ncbi:MAG: SDR family NAD(P)-dependent oxidoreductase [Myxococcota bacterium]|nr:SDR family NAD(P)-dependent oxidoreductase [Myxococcota bacterium]